MSFSLFGIEIIPSESLFGIWVLSIHNWETEWHRPLLGLHYNNGEIIFHVFFIQFEIDLCKNR